MWKYIDFIRKNWVFVVLFFVVFVVFFVRFYVIEGHFSIDLGNPKDALVVAKTTEVWKRYIVRDPNFAKKNEKIGWMTDIHADRFKRRTVKSGTVYPKQYEEYVPKVFDALRAQGIDTVFTSGDNVNSGDDNYGRALERIAQEKHMRVIWTMGNHDSEESMATFGITGEKYYFVDYGNTRLVVIDNVEVTKKTGDYAGGIDAVQLDWLRGVLKTEKQVMITMHIPIFPFSLETIVEENVAERYSEFEELIRNSGNVKIVFSGHFHVPWQKELNGIRYYGEAALTHDDYKGAYGVIDLKNNSVEYLFAQ